MDMDAPGVCWYTPDFLVFGCSRAVASELFPLFAARRTDRLIDQATRIRQSTTAKPKRPKAAPTAINMVPSGKSDCFRYGAPSFGGICGVGIEKAPVSVGRVGIGLLSLDELVVVVDAEVEVEVELLEESVVSPGRFCGGLDSDSGFSVSVGFGGGGGAVVGSSSSSSSLFVSVGGGGGGGGGLLVVSGGLGRFGVGVSFGDSGLFVGAGVGGSELSLCAATWPASRPVTRTNRKRHKNGLEANPPRGLLMTELSQRKNFFGAGSRERNAASVNTPSTSRPMFPKSTAVM